MDPLLLILKGYTTGWLVAAPIGPVNLEIIRRTLREGALAGLAVGFGAACIDMTCLLVFSMGLGELLRGDTVRRVASVLGGLVLIVLGTLALREARRWWLRRGEALMMAQHGDGRRSGWRSMGRHFTVGLLMTSLNPMTIAFWSSVSLEFADLAMMQRLAASLAVMAGCFSWVMTIVTIVTLARRRVGARMFAIATAAGGLFLIFFGVRLLLRG